MTLDDGIPKVAERAVLSLESVREAGAEIRGAAEPLAGIAAEADRLTAALGLARDLPDLHTPDVGQRALAAMRLAALLASSMMVMAAESRHRAAAAAGEDGADNHLRHHRQPDDGSAEHEYGHLEAMLGQLRDARTALEGALRAAYVGLSGDKQEGFRVSRARLVAANERVREALGEDLVLFERLREKLGEGGGKFPFLPTRPQATAATKSRGEGNSSRVGSEAGGSVLTCQVGIAAGDDGDLIKLDDADSERLGLPQKSSTMIEQWRAGLSD